MSDEQLELWADSSPELLGRVEVVGNTDAQDPDPGSAALWREIQLSEAVDQYQIVDAQPGHIVMADRNPNLDPYFALQELGYSSPSPWTSWTREEYVPELRGRLGLVKYFRMKRNDGVVKGSLGELKTPVRGAHWFVEPPTDSPRDKTIADFVADNLFDGLNVSWSKLLDDILLIADYGYFFFEKVYDFNAQGKLVLRKLAPRHPLDVRNWEYDKNGGPNGVVMESNSDMTLYDLGVYIPIEKLAVFSLEPEAGDMCGQSVLRTAYKHWYYKDQLYKIDAIQKERHGIGIPVIKLPLGWNDADKRMADNLGRNLRTNERAHIVLPPGWEILFAKLEGHVVNCMESIEHHDMAIAVNILAPFMKDTKPSIESTGMFLKSTRYLASTITDIFNRHIIPQLVNFNFQLGPDRKYPQLVCRRIGEWEDIRTQSFALRNLVGAGIIQPDTVLEAHLRKELDLPPIDEATIRMTKATAVPPTPSRAGPPRQSTQPPVGTPAPNAGIDKSG